MCRRHPRKGKQMTSHAEQFLIVNGKSEFERIRAALNGG